MLDTCLYKISTSNSIGIIILDSKKAFDKVNPFILIEKLKLYLTNSNTTDFIQSYLSNRQECVCINDNKPMKGSNKSRCSSRLIIKSSSLVNLQ